MAAGGTTFVKTQRIQGFTTVLTSAACEWFLIFLLLINAGVSYLLTKFASYCDLQAPCVLCSRLDRLINGEKNQGFDQSLICSNHKSEISSLVTCHIHDKIADGHGMCDDCLLSFIPKNKLNPKTHRLLVGKLGLFISGCGFKKSLQSRDGSNPCTCCGKLWNSGKNAKKSAPLKSSGKVGFKAKSLNLQDNLKKISGKSFGRRENSFGSLSLAEYTELNLASDSESEFAFSDDNDFGSLIRGNVEARSIPISQFPSVVPHEVSNSNPAKSNSISFENEPLTLYPYVEPNINKRHDLNFTGSIAVNDYGLGEINWQLVNQKSSIPELPELISLNEVSPSPDVVDIPIKEPENSKKNICLSQNSLPAALSEFMTSDTHPSVDASPDKSAASDSGCEIKTRKEGLEKIITRAEASIHTSPHVNDSHLSSPRHDNSSNMNEFPATTKEKDLPGVVAEHPTRDEVNTINEEFKLPRSHHSSPLLSNMPSVVPIDHVHHPEIQTNNSSSFETRGLQESASVESGLDFFYGSSVSEIEGESMIDRLKRQIEHDKKCISDLQKELEAERNASEVAANESMAMITRLQEEKAVLHMEALQYLRMMDEQAEYDGDELDRANDLLAEKEKEIQDLESELEFYRLNLEDETMGLNKQMRSYDLNGENITVKNCSVPPINISSNSNNTEVSDASDEFVVDETSLEFKDEKLYILSCLKSLEKKLGQISYNSMPKGRPENFEESKSDQQGSSSAEEPQLDGQKDNNDLSNSKGYNTCNGSLADQADPVSSKSDDCSPSKENNCSASDGSINPPQRKNADWVALENEISDLNERLEALEADHDLLEHIMRSLQYENDALQFIREIAHQLHDLRKIRTTQRW